MLPKKWWQLLILAIISLGLVITALVALAALLIYPTLPSLEVLTDYRPKIPLRVYSSDNFLIGEFGEERRAFVKINDVPQNLKSAILAIEDRRFYQHGGVDTRGVLRAAVTNFTGQGHEGASTITMQVARNFFLSSEQTFKRKINEALLAIKIEHNLSKDKIFELYINQIYLGQRAYGFAAASQVYFGKPLENLNLAEAALLAGLPKAPSSANPFANLKRATNRQHEVLHDMYRFGFIDKKTFDGAMQQPLRLRVTHQTTDLSADYVAEIARQTLYEQHGEAIYSSGMRVYTTILKTNQQAANNAVLQNILGYDRRHGYRGPEKFVSAPENVEATGNNWMDKALDEFETFSGLIPAIVTDISSHSVKVHTKTGEDIEITGSGLALIQNSLGKKVTPKTHLEAGAVIRVMHNGDAWQITQLPQVESAFVALDPESGAVRALVGGFDFNRNKFNHVTQAWRQPGSSFKPFIYSASLEKGFTPASVIQDEPLYLSAEETGSSLAWEPHNFDNRYDGPIRMRTALTKSKNMVSIRILRAIGVNYAQEYITRFGFSAKDHPAYLTMALGSGSVTPWQMAGAYAVFANGGYLVKPYLISKITDSSGRVLEQTKINLAAKGAPRVIDARNAFLMTSMMQDVVRSGTAASARQLGRNDLAGKTGTTNNQFDTWFAGFSPKQVAVAWMGFDQPRSLGSNETGGHAALPIWIRYMATALKNLPDLPLEIPEGIDSIKINPSSGMPASGDTEGIYEYFYHEYPPQAFAHSDSSNSEEVISPIPGMSDTAEPPVIPGASVPQGVPFTPGAHEAPTPTAPPVKTKPQAEPKFSPIPGHSAA
jgi:penicillin-binding protein 1A